MRARMNKGLLITIIGGGLIVLLTAIFAFTPNSANPSSIPALKSYALSLINNERINYHFQPLHQGPDILADNQAKFLLTQPTLTHLDSSGNSPSERYSKNNQTGYVAENLSVYHCGDIDACKTAISFAIDDMMKHKESHANILNPELTHVGTGIAVGNGKVVMVFDFEV
ncbi:MAG: CAP domain-containing protein [Candidatus Nitrosopolaris sp.]|jgi:uncharacterized protein YkwD